MPDAVAAQQGQGQGGRQQQQQKPQNVIWTVARMFFVWYLINRFFGGKPNTANLPRDQLLVPKFQKGFAFDLTVFLSEYPHYDLGR